jgi:hypothetical protein
VEVRPVSLTSREPLFDGLEDAGATDCTLAISVPLPGKAATGALWTVHQIPSATSDLVKTAN